MKTTLNADGQIGIPQEIRDTDHLAVGDSFDLERLASGHYVLAKQSRTTRNIRFAVVTGTDGLPVIRVANGTISSELVKEIESRTA